MGKYTRLFLLVVTSTAAILVGSCSSNNGAGGAPTAPSGSITLAAAQSIAASGGGATKALQATQISSSSATNTFLTPSTRDGRPIDIRGTDFTCTSGTAVQDPVTPVDADADGIPATQTATFTDCVSSSREEDSDRSSGSFKINGSYTIKDEDDTKAFPAAGMSGSITGFKFEYTSSRGSSFSFSEDGTFSLALTATTATLADAITATITGTDGTTTVNTSIGYFINATATATRAGDIAKAGTMTFKSFLKYKDAQNDFTLELDATGVTYDKTACTSTYFKDGTITIKDGGTNTITFVYTNCALVKTAVIDGKSTTLTR